MMPKHRVTLPAPEWPAELRETFERSADRLSVHQRQRLSRAVGRWLKDAQDEGLPPDLVSVDLWRARTAKLDRTRAHAVRQALAMVVPEMRAALYAPDADRMPVRSERDKLAALIERSLPRWPADWRMAAAPLLMWIPMGPTTES
jgi:hypothetical protein